MPLDITVPKVFARVPNFQRLRQPSYADEMVFSVPCTDPAAPNVIPVLLHHALLRVGDVICFHRIADPASIAIHLYQQQVVGFPPTKARITHVALYAGEGMVWDHCPTHNIKKRTLSSMMTPNRTISVSRPRAAVDRDRLRAQCQTLQAQRNYVLFRGNAWRLLYARARGKTRLGNAAMADQGLVCSSFVSSVLAYASKNGVDFRDLVTVLPGDFADAALFDRIDIDWSRL